MRIMKIACSKTWGSGESTTTTRREIPFAKKYTLLLPFCYIQYDRGTGLLYAGRGNSDLRFFVLPVLCQVQHQYGAVIAESEKHDGLRDDCAVLVLHVAEHGQGEKMQV